VKPAVVFVVVTEFGGPGYRNSGSDAEYVTEGVRRTKLAAQRLARAAARQYRGFGHEEWTGENPDTWAFDMHVEEHWLK
jgi:hypothetical protein